MREEMIITEEDLKTRFQGERDLITYAPYRVGDRVVRCGSCHAVIKTEFITENRCPLCAHAPFVPCAVNAVQSDEEEPSCRRSLSTFLKFLALAIVLAFVPFGVPEASEFLQKAMFGIESEVCLCLAGVVSAITAIVLYNHPDSRRVWQHAKVGWLLALAPTAAPYIIVAAIWVVLVAVALAIVVACCAIVIGLIESIFE